MTSFTIEDIIKYNDKYEELKSKELTISLNDDFTFDMKDDIITIDEKIIEHIIFLNSIEKNIVNNNTNIIIDESPSKLLILMKCFMGNNYKNFFHYLMKYLLNTYDFHNLFVLMRAKNTDPEIINIMIENANKTHEYVCKFLDDHDFTSLYAYKNYNIIPKLHYKNLFEYEDFNPNHSLKKGSSLITWLMSASEQKSIIGDNLYASLAILFKHKNYKITTETQELSTLLLTIIRLASPRNLTAEMITNILKILICQFSDINDLFRECLNNKYYDDTEKEIVLNIILNDEKIDPNHINNLGESLIRTCLFSQNCSNVLKLNIAQKIVGNKKFIG
jgi:hypothetical protein